MFTLAYEFVVFALAVTLTPGPNNIMLLSSGANYGWRPTLPHIFGINVGYNSLLLWCGLGLGELFKAYPVMQDILRYGGGVYLLYLAWRVLQASRPKASSHARPFRFIEAFAFQYVNPKAVVMAVTIMTVFAGNDAVGSGIDYQRMFLIIALNVFVSLFCSNVWIFFGVAISRLLRNDVLRRIFNAVMAGLLVLTIYWVILP